jgi:hypothetical protein
MAALSTVQAQRGSMVTSQFGRTASRVLHRAVFYAMRRHGKGSMPMGWWSHRDSLTFKATPAAISWGAATVV